MSTQTIQILITAVLALHGVALLERLYSVHAVGQPLEPWLAAAALLAESFSLRTCNRSHSGHLLAAGGNWFPWASDGFLGHPGAR